MLLRLAFGLLLALAVVWFGLGVLDSLLGPFAPLLGAVVLALIVAALLRRPDGG
jgi:hypothetical protein